MATWQMKGIVETEIPYHIDNEYFRISISVLLAGNFTIRVRSDKEQIAHLRATRNVIQSPEKYLDTDWQKMSVYSDSMVSVKSPLAIQKFLITLREEGFKPHPDQTSIAFVNSFDRK